MKGVNGILTQQYQLVLQDQYDPRSGQLIKKEIIPTKHVVEHLTSYLLCIKNQAEYRNFIKWYEREIRQVLKEHPEQDFIIKISFQQLYFRETMLLLENIKAFSKQITIELVGDSQISAGEREHFSPEDIDAFLKGRLKMLKKWHYFISKHIESGAMEQTLIFTPYIDELKYSLKKGAKLLDNQTELAFFLSFWKSWAKLRCVHFVLIVDEMSTDFPEEVAIRCEI
ncbi:diguanylate phosphodiesterase [Listeria monocytogenes]|nr:diguanylate phosphodiesterase [Listeria monocytogenes]EAG4304998.1 diguanylate phosphodiesterase [Listeria monocytogenes]EAK8417473.1 diguanylate phosphodiesterase [Listeria monocytogenes]EAW7127768.1 diguanylate phosphodiesterase [Listeria monocytogenes]EAW7193036.1 diguanylate phosphodiesterase [Listeria monocytogenes]